MRIGSLILAGGRSRRMGEPKESLQFLGEPLLVRVVRRLAAGTQPVVVVARGRDQVLPPLPPGVQVVPDPEPDLGPLAAIATGLRALAAGRESAPEFAFVTGCDAPFVSARTVAGLAAAADDADLVLPRAAGVPQPLCALYALRVLPAVEALLAEGSRMPRALAARVRTRWLDEAELRTFDPGLDLLRNVNTPADYRDALADAAARPPEPAG